MPRKVPEKGKPDFSNLDDSRVRQYKDTVVDLMGNFQDVPEVYNALEIVWRALSDECTDRLCSMPDVPKKPPEMLMKKRLVRSPLIKKFRK